MIENGLKNAMLIEKTSLIIFIDTLLHRMTFIISKEGSKQTQFNFNGSQESMKNIRYIRIESS